MRPKLWKSHIVPQVFNFHSIKEIIIDIKYFLIDISYFRESYRLNAISDFDRLIGHQESAKVKFGGGDPFDIDDDGIGDGHSTLKM